MPRTMVNAAMGKYLTVFGEIKLTFYQSVGELARVDCERADISRDLFSIFFKTLAEDHFKHSRATLMRCAIDQGDEVRINCQRHWGRSSHGKHCTCDIDTGTRARSLAEFEVFYKEGRNNLHAYEGNDT